MAGDTVKDISKENNLEDLDWRANKKFIFEKIEHLETESEYARKALDEIKTGVHGIELTLAEKLTSLSMKSSFWGAMASLPGTLLALAALVITIFRMV